ncbi:MAG: HlyD family efflux transporter periplasmic adaptor subunit [Opitutaceae bacterium]|jgi:HlyD family secretion protein
MTPNARRADQEALESESPLLPADPPHWVVLGTAWLIIALFATALLALVLVHVPETIRCPCVLVPERGADPIQSPRLAIIREVRAGEGREVAAGEELFVLSSEDVGDRATAERTLEEDLASLRRNLKQAEVTNAEDLEIKDHEIAQADEEVKFRENYVAVERDLAARYEKLSKVGVYSEQDMVLRKLELAGAERDLSVASRTREQVILQRQQMASEQARQRSDQLAEIEKAEIRLAALKRQLEDSNRNLVSIRAPYDAVVVSLSANNPGSVVQSGQELCQLARTDAKLRVRLLLAEEGLPRLAVGQRVRFFSDAFPYQRYGTITGTLSWISPSAVTTRDGRQFVALAKLDQEAFQVGGHPRPLRVGMRGEARIVVGSRTLIEYVLEPVRQLRENMRRSSP